MSYSYDGTRLYEGLCPTCITELELEDSIGWCKECGYGYTLRNGEVRVHFPLNGDPILDALRIAERTRP